MKRDVCVVKPDDLVPAERLRPVGWHISACSPGTTCATNYPFDSKLASENFKRFIDSPGYGSCFKILYEGETAGYIILVKYFSFEFGGEILFLDELYVKPDFQGKSLGKSALGFVKNYAVENHYKVVMLEIENHNERAKQLYEHYGFQNHKRSLMILKN